MVSRQCTKTILGSQPFGSNTGLEDHSCPEIELQPTSEGTHLLKFPTHTHKRLGSQLRMVPLPGYLGITLSYFLILSTGPFNRVSLTSTHLNCHRCEFKEIVDGHSAPAVTQAVTLKMCNMQQGPHDSSCGTRHQDSSSSLMTAFVAECKDRRRCRRPIESRVKTKRGGGWYAICVHTPGLPQVYPLTDESSADHPL